MSSTALADAVGLKQKSQLPAAKAKRMKRLQENPDFEECVEYERKEAKMYEVAYEKAHLQRLEMEMTAAKLRHMASETLSLYRTNRILEGQVARAHKMDELQEKIINSLQDNAAQQEIIIAAQERTIQSLQKARNPHRVTGGKRGRPRGSKSKAIRYGADAMPDRDMVPLGTISEAPPSSM